MTWDWGGFELMAEFHCEQPGCSVCDLFRLDGPADPAWVARLSSEAQRELALLRQRSTEPLISNEIASW